MPNPSPDHEFGDGFILVPCNKCINCLKNRAREWFLRLSVEASDLNYQSVSFVTLTYDEDHVHYCTDGKYRYFQTLRKKDLQNFFKRLRNFADFKYYAIGEYGTHTFRPHYHFLLFSISPIDAITSAIDDCWKSGFSLVEPVSPARIGYVLHYHTRPKIPPHVVTFQFEDDEFEPAFAVSSRGLGVSLFTDDLINYLYSSGNGSVHYNGVRYKLPRYYIKKFGVELQTKDLESHYMRLKNLWSKDSFTLQDYENFFIDIMEISRKKQLSYNTQTKLV